MPNVIANAGTWDNAYESKEEKYIIFQRMRNINTII